MPQGCQVAFGQLPKMAQNSSPHFEAGRPASSTRNGLRNRTCPQPDRRNMHGVAPLSQMMKPALWRIMTPMEQEPSTPSASAVRPVQAVSLHSAPNPPIGNSSVNDCFAPQVGRSGPMWVLREADVRCGDTQGPHGRIGQQSTSHAPLCRVKAPYIEREIPISDGRCPCFLDVRIG